MGILKEITNAENMIYSYHKIGKMRVSSENNRVTDIEVLSYKDKFSRDNNYQPRSEKLILHINKENIEKYLLDDEGNTIIDELGIPVKVITANENKEFNYSFEYNGLKKVVKVCLSVGDDYDKSLLDADIKKVYQFIMENPLFSDCIED